MLDTIHIKEFGRNDYALVNYYMSITVKSLQGNQMFSSTKLGLLPSPFLCNRDAT